MPDHSLAVLHPNCPTCQLTKRLLAVIEGVSFEDAMTALSHATGMALFPVVIEAGMEAPAALDEAVAIFGRQTLDMVHALADAAASDLMTAH